MYGLPRDVDLSFVVGKTVELVSFSQNTVFLAFDGDVSLTITSSFEFYRRADDEEATVQTVPVKQSDLMHLLGRQVEGAAGVVDGTLTLKFCGGARLRCFDDSANYESYRIAHGDHEIVV